MTRPSTSTATWIVLAVLAAVGATSPAAAATRPAKRERPAAPATGAAGATSAAAAPAAARPVPAQVSDLRYPPLPGFTIPRAERVVLGNGLVLMLLEDHDLPLVEGLVKVHAGSREEPAAKRGLAALTGTVLRTGGTKARTGDAIDDLLEGIGAQLEIGIGVDQGQGSFSCLSRDLDTVLGVLAEVLREPAFAQDKLDVARAQARTAIARRNDDVQSIASREFAKRVYGPDAVYARHTEYATLDAVTRDDLVAFHRARFHPGAVLLGLTGDFDRAAARALVEKHFGSWAKGPAPARFEGGFEPETKPGLFFVEKADVNQASIVLGHLGIRSDAPDVHAVAVLNEVFGSGFSSRLFSHIRSDKGLAYGVSGRVGDDFDHPETFRISMTTKSGTTLAAMRALDEEIAAIRKEPPTGEELQRAKDGILNSFIFRFDTRREVLARQMTYEYFGYPADYLERYRAGIEKVTAADVHAAALARIQPERLVRLVVGKAQDFDGPLSSLGTVTTLDVTIPPPAGKAAPPAPPGSRAKGQEAVERAMAAFGGKPALAAVRGFRAVSRVTMRSPEGEMTLPMTVLFQAPDRMRQEMDTPGGKAVMVLSGDQGSMTMGGQTQPAPEERRKETIRSAHRALVVLLGDPALEATHLGRVEVAGQPADAVLVRAAGNEVTLSIADDGRVLQDEFTGSGPGGAPGTVLRTYSGWKKTGAYTLAHQVDATFDGKPYQSIAFESIEVNPEVAADTFAIAK